MNFISRFIWSWFSFSIPGAILLFPFSYDFFGFYNQLLKSIFEPPVQWIKINLFHWQKPFSSLESDSSSLYVLMLLVFVSGFVYALFRSFVFKNESNILNKSFRIGKVISLSFLSLILIKYGLTKIFGGQFYEPEPNILFTEFGNLDLDILYWSIMGRSYSYNLFIGITELLVGIGLLIRKTRFISLVAALFVCVNILAVNLSFGISVKVLSSLLLMVTLYLLIPRVIEIHKAYRKKDLNSLLKTKAEKRSTLKIFLHLVIFLSIVLESLAPHFDNGFRFEWQREKSDLHGAYKFESSLTKDSFLNVDFLFIHRANYFILKRDNQFVDFHFTQNDDMILLEDYQANQKELQFELNKNGLRIIEDDDVYLFTKIDLNEMKQKDSQFKFTVD